LAVEPDTLFLQRQWANVSNHFFHVLSLKLGSLLPGTPTIPQQIQDDREAYFNSLEAADVAFRNNEIDVSGMEQVLKAMLATQLVSAIEAVGGDILSN
jgi:hypothetical protein